MGLKGKDLLSVQQLSTADVQQIFDLAHDLKQKQKEGIEHPLLKGKTLGMIFQKASTRTRVSFEVAIWQLGGMGLFLNANDLQLGRGEPVKDTARVLSRYVDGIMIRTFGHNEVEDLACYATVPVINGLTDSHHPCQALADIFTILEHKGRLKGLKLAFIGDGNNVAHSLMEAGAKVGMDVAIACPPDYMPDSRVVKAAQQEAEANGSRIFVVHDPQQAARGADVLYTDAWASMGQEQEKLARRQAFAGFQINADLMSLAKPDAIIMHCLPAYRGEEITDQAMESSQSVVFDEAENRLHVQKAILALLMGGMD